MEDTRYEYYQDINNKASVATSAHRTTTKGLERTRKEIKAMTGECVTYDLKKRLTWGEFKKWPDKYKMEYLQRLYSTFHPAKCDLMTLFNTSQYTIGAFFKANPGMKSPEWRRGGSLKSVAGKPSWEAFLAGEAEEELAKKEEKEEGIIDIPVEEVEQEQEVHEAELKDKLHISRPSFDFLRFGLAGTVDDICNAMKRMCMDGTYHFTIIATKGAYGEEE